MLHRQHPPQSGLVHGCFTQQIRPRLLSVVELVTTFRATSDGSSDIARAALGPTWSCRCPAPICPKGSTSPIPICSKPAYRTRSSPGCARPHRSGGAPSPCGISGFDDEGYWVVTRHADVKYVSTRPELFSSNTNTAVIRFNETISRDQIDVQKLIMLNMDPPEHTRVRQIVQRGFTPAPSVPWNRRCAAGRARSSRRRWPPRTPTARSTSSTTSPSSCRSRPSPS